MASDVLMTVKSSWDIFQWQHSVWESDKNAALVWFHSLNKINLLRIKPCCLWMNSLYPCSYEITNLWSNHFSPYPSLPTWTEPSLSLARTIVTASFLISLQLLPPIYATARGILLKHNLVYVSSLLSSLQRIPPPQYEIQGPTKPISPSVSHHLLQGSLLSSHPGLLAVPETGQGHSHLKAMHLLFLLPGIFFP